MIHAAISRFRHFLTFVPEQVRQLSEEAMTHQPAPGKWSKKEIVGHLIDSALNNHNRFVRAQYEPQPFVLTRYDQNKWVAINGYQHTETPEVLALWMALNRQILRVIEQIPEEKLSYQCQSSDQAPVTLAWLITDYVDHLEHHLKQMDMYPAAH